MSFLKNSFYLLRVTKNAKIVTNQFINYWSFRRNTSTSNKGGCENSQNVGNIGEKIDIPPEPTECCNSACSNCVWIKYAQELGRHFENGDVIAKNKIKEKVRDPNLRAFLFVQLGIDDK